MFPSSTKREIWKFHAVVVQPRLRNVPKSVMHVQSCCFANLNLLLLCRSRWCRRRLCLNSLVLPSGHKKQGSSYLCFDYVHSLRPGHRAFSSNPEARAPWGRFPINQNFRFEFLATSSSECNSIFKNFQKKDNCAWCTRSVPNFENFFPFNFAPRIGHLR